MEKLIVISGAAFIPGEHTLINSLFASGLGLLHLRKPGCREQDMVALLHRIDSVYHSRIAVHQHHAAAVACGIRRLHFPESERSLGLFSHEFSYSTSVHTAGAYNELDPVFSYTFYSPVFRSISKKDYREPVSMEAVTNITKQVKIVALGGIDTHNCLAPFQYGFDGIAVLGAIWERNDPLGSFKKIQACITTGL